MISIMEILMEESRRVECHDAMYLVVCLIINILWHWHLLFRNHLFVIGLAWPSSVFLKHLRMVWLSTVINESSRRIQSFLSACGWSGRQSSCLS